MTPEMIKDLIDIYNHFGDEYQKIKMVSECHEYIKAVKDSNSNFAWYIKGTPEEKEDAVIDESADVFIMAYQRYLTNPKIQDRVNFKIERTKERIKSGYYDKRI